MRACDVKVCTEDCRSRVLTEGRQSQRGVLCAVQLYAVLEKATAERETEVKPVVTKARW